MRHSLGRVTSINGKSENFVRDEFERVPGIKETETSAI